MPAAEISAAQAAKKAGVSAGALRNWLSSEPSLKKVVVRRKGRVHFPPAALTALEEIKKKRMAAAPASLRKAWAARRSKSKGTASRKMKPAARRPASATTSPKARTRRAATVVSKAPKALSSKDAAKSLGVAIVTMYQRMQRQGIKPPGKAVGSPGTELEFAL